MENSKLPKYKGIILQYSLKYILLDEVFKESVCEHHMELREKVEKAMEKYAKNALKLSAAVRKARRKITKL
jgi:hypothetical protein